MMKKLCYMLAVALAIVLCVGCDTEQGHLYDEGVSMELAQKRKATIKELVYDLHFAIPDSIGQAVDGRVAISFALDEADEVVVDFRQPAEKIHSVEVNGQSAEYFAVNEHIVIGNKWTIAGQNTIVIDFEAGDQSLNRNEEFMYTLLVPDRARTLFPCFDQPNLKAEYRLSLEMPAQWEAVANSPILEESVDGNRKSVKFSPTEPLSTYLFSFVVGKFDKAVYEDNGRKMVAYHRETDPKRVAQLDEIFAQVVSSLDWLEDYTDIKYPFRKYDFVILPGFQYGGMEHTGATLYNDTRIFLSENPTAEEQLQRIQLIAHETAHMWFGDYVTMAWFDDVWTKEVFANYFAARITEPLYPDINHRLNWLKMTTTPALKEDRTAGTNPIKQPLDNLADAGLVYGNIIYCKSPVVLEKLVEIMGEEAFREGIKEYLKTFAYGNATWEDLIAIMDSRCDADLTRFSNVWVNERGLPQIDSHLDNGVLKISQSAPLGRNLTWPQGFEVMLVGDSIKTMEVKLYESATELIVDKDVVAVLPNSDGRGYGHFVIDEQSRKWIVDNWKTLDDATLRMSLLISLHENHWNRLITDEEWSKFLVDAMQMETDELVFSSLSSYLSEVMSYRKDSAIEKQLLQISTSHSVASCRLQAKRVLYTQAVDAQVIEQLYQMWHNADDELLSEHDYTTLSYELALRYPQRSEEILAMQRSRITNADRQRQFDFISQAVVADVAMRDKFFESLMDPANRVTEPWVATALSYLNHHLHQPDSRRYIRRALDELKEVQRTGDIFFPRNWTMSLLGNYHDEQARLEVEAFLNDNPGNSPLLTNKILQASASLYR